MVDTGMNRLGLRYDELSAAEGLNVHTLHSHLACADEDHTLNDVQLRRFREVAACLPARRRSLANSAGVFLGREFSFDLVRPGLALYGGIPRPEAREIIQQVVVPEAQVLQSRHVPAGESVGYNATFLAPCDMTIAILNVGYADGFWRSFGRNGSGRFGGVELPIVGRVSMDLLALDVTKSPQIGPGDWIELPFSVEQLAADTGMSQYELLTGLGRRWQRQWT
jgi:alanine racemase